MLWLRAPALLLSVIGVALAGSTCTFSGIAVVVPPPSTTITSFAFPIEIQIASHIDAASVGATLNGAPLALQWDGGLGFTAQVGPGPPLRDQNVLVVSGVDNLGAPRETVRNFAYLPPKARARRITAPADLVTGPLAHGRVGDWLLENGRARFVIQDGAQRDLHSVGQYGGNLIDAELVVDGVRQGRDNFFEIQPSVNIESVINAQTVEIVNDGQDGTAAIVRACGPDDLLDYINPSSQVADLGVSLPPGVDDQDYAIEGCTDYRLEPGKRHVELETALQSLEAQDLPLYVGDYVNGMGELEQWVSPSNSSFSAGVGEGIFTVGNATFSYFGFGEAEGVDYAFVGPQPPETLLPSSSFSVSGVTFIVHGHSVPLVLGAVPPTFSVPANGTASFRRFFGVGDGSGANAVDIQIEEQALASGTVRGCVTVGSAGGPPVAGARVAAGVLVSGRIDTLRGHWVTGADGCYEGRLPVGTYGVAASKQGFPYEGGGTLPLVHPVALGAGASVVQDVVLPETARLRVVVRDPGGEPLPARLSVVGFDPSPEALLVEALPFVGNSVSATFYDVSKDGTPFGLVRTEFVGPTGELEIDLEPGSYNVAVSRGTEYSLFTELVTIEAATTRTVNATIVRVLDTPGFVSGDYHVHQIDSPDSRIAHGTRVFSFGAEGVETLVSTDHDAVSDLQPAIDALGLTPFVHNTKGEEITTFDYGHFNAYPQGQDPARIQSHGSTDWARPAPPGQDFPSAGAYARTPAEIHAAVLSDPANAGLETVVHVNHINSHFDPLRIDTSEEPPQSHVPDPTLFRLDPSVANFFHPFPALELWNGASSGDQNEFLAQRMGIWMNLLNQGFPTTAIADTDTHTAHNLAGAGARTWTASSTDAAAAISDLEIARAVRGGRAVGGQGLYVQARITAASTGGVADFTRGGTTLVSTSDGSAELEIHAQAPAWAPFDRIEIYRNATTTVARRRGGTPTLFGALPTQVLTAGVDFQIQTLDVVPGVLGATRLDAQLSVPLALPEDAWVVVVVKGSPGVSAPMFPVYPHGTSSAQNPTLAELWAVTATESGTRALGFTNALYVDVDGNGEFDPPGVSVAP
jgi:hypothetical protein